MGESDRDRERKKERKKERGRYQQMLGDREKQRYGK